MKLSTAKAIRFILWAVAVVLAIIGALFESVRVPFLLAACAATIATAVFWVACVKCPHCGVALGRSVGEYCPHCGKKIQ